MSIELNPKTINKLDTLIIGQGLAGSLLAWQLLQRGQSIAIIDKPSPTAASRVAAGLINPLPGRRFKKTPQADQLLPIAVDFYTRLETFFNQKFYHPKTMIRLFQNDAEKAFWLKRCNDPDYQHYLGQHIAPNELLHINSPFGGFTQKQTGYVDLPFLLDTLLVYLQQHTCYTSSHMTYNDIFIDHNHISALGIVAKNIIFCEGSQAINNPWFAWLPFLLAKGDILTLKSAGELPDKIINSANWILPLSQNHFRFGATYAWHFDDDKPTPAAKKTLLENLKLLLHSVDTLTVSNHKAGIRPCTRDRLPFIGQHPENARLGFFNGFGSKGALLIPYYASIMADMLTLSRDIPADVDIKRNWKHE